MTKSFKIIIVSLIAFLLSGCTDNENAQRILKNNGYKNVRLTGYNLFACSKDDFYHTGFIAESPIGKPVSGTVCSGIFFKNSTIRFE